MQLMSWTIARLGSRFSLFFDPHHHRVLHSALGRFLDQPLDLMVGLIEPDGTERVMPFTTRGRPLYNLEQFERLNSITFRGYSERYRLRFEFNIHSVFYPQDEALCLMPAFYLEMRVSPCARVRDSAPAGPTPDRVKLFLRLNRNESQITASPEGGGRLDMSYRVPLTPGNAPGTATGKTVEVRERIVSLSSSGECSVDSDGKGLSLELPVSNVGSGVKWRMVWGAFCGEPILEVDTGDGPRKGRLRYLHIWDSLDEVMDEAIRLRDDRLALSRRIEKIAEQSPMRNAERHLINQSFQSFLSNTFWCSLDPLGGDAPTGDGGYSGKDGHEKARAAQAEWFSVWEGAGLLHSTLDVEYNASLLYLSIWPRLLSLQLNQWASFTRLHKASNGAFMQHDLGRGLRIAGQAYPYDMPVEENANFLLMMQAHAHMTGDLSIVRKHADLIEKLANYLVWCDREKSGFPSEGTANTLVDASPAMHTGTKQTYLAVKRLAALDAAADLLGHAGRGANVAKLEALVQADAAKIEAVAWLGEHYAASATCSQPGRSSRSDTWDTDAIPEPTDRSADAYSIHTANGLLLPMITGQPVLFDAQRLLTDLTSAVRETLTPYGCSHTSSEPDNIWVSQNLWRDHIARYLGLNNLSWVHNYWDLQVLSNTGALSLGFSDAYIGNSLIFHPRGITSIGLMLAYPRLVIDRLAPGGARISVDPDRHYPQRWPLLPLADWRAGRVPICVVHANGRVSIEGEGDPVIVRGDAETTGVIG